MQIEFSDQDAWRTDRIVDETDYESPEQFVRNAVRRRLAALEPDVLTSTQLKGDLFDCEIIPSDEQSPPGLRFSPQAESSIRIKHFAKGDPPHTALMDTGDTFVGADEIEEELANITGISDCTVPNTTGDIRFTISESNESPLEDIIDRIRDGLYELIREREQRIEQGEESRQEAKKRAIKDYWKYSHQL